MTEPQAVLTHVPAANIAGQMGQNKSPLSFLIPQSMSGRMLAVILLAALLPVIFMGWLGYTTIYNHIVEKKIHDVGLVADNTHGRLIERLSGAHNRAGQFLDINLGRCKVLFGQSAAQTEPCLRAALTIYVEREKAAGAVLRRPEAGDLVIGAHTVDNPDSWKLQPGQLAIFPPAKNQSDRLYHIAATDPQSQSRLIMTYPVGLLQDIFIPPRVLGESGEIFLADSNGLFITKPKYPSGQGHSVAISAIPMQTCLQHKNMEMLELDYRAVPIIHGFHYVPEIGGCIMAHIDQHEAFEPVKLLGQRLVIAILLFCIFIVIITLYLARSIVKPLNNLTKTARAIAAGDYKIQAEGAGGNEVLELATSFNFMTKQLLDSRDELHYLLNSMVEGVYGVDTDGNCTFVNQQFLTMLSYQNENEVLGKNMHNLIHHSHPDGKPYPRSECKIYRAFQGNKAVNISDEVFWRKDGVAVQIEYWSHPVMVSGVVTGSIVTFVDITERKLADNMLRVAAIAFETHEAITIADRQGNIIRVNKAFEKITGYSQEEVLGKNPRILSSGRQDEAFYEAMWQQITSKGSWTGELWNKRKNGEIFPEQLTIAAVKNVWGETTEYVGIFSDITGRKQAEEALHKHYEELEAMNHQLRDTQNLLMQSEKMSSIGQLAAGVAHEINNPIGYVYSNLGTLDKYVQDVFAMVDAYEQAEGAISDENARTRLQAARKKLDMGFLKEDLRALMAESKDGITRVKQIVQNLKDFSHVDATDEWHFADLHKGLDSTLNIVNNEIKYKADVIKEYGDLPEVECLSSQLNQVFMNLLVNAAHAIEERGTITVRTGQQDGKVWVEIADTGKGIATEHLKKIFDPFFTTKPVGKGTGLGLSLSYGIIQKHHGRIEVQSEVGKGTTFRVWLPVKQMQDDGNNKEAA